MRPLPSFSVLMALLCAGAASAQTTTQATGVKAAFRNGQTFLTWKEATALPAPERYAVYRSTMAIAKPADLTSAVKVATVPAGSYLNSRAGVPFKLEASGNPLQKGDGYVVLTAAQGRTHHYAVLAVTGGNENRTITTGTGGNTTGAVQEKVEAIAGVLQSVTGGVDHHYVLFLPAVTTTAVAAMTNREGRALNYRIVWDKTKTGPRPVYVVLHQRGGSYKQQALSWIPSNSVQIIPDDDNSPGVHDVWFGYHERYTQAPPGGKVHDYTERRVMWHLNEVLTDAAMKADKNRVYSLGVSLGAMGSLALGVRRPDVFAACGGLVPAFGLRHNDFSLKSEIAVFFGTPQQNLESSLGQKVYDLFDYHAQVAKHAKRGVAPMLFTVGRLDIITGWSEKPAFFRASYQNRQPLAFYWDFRAHAGTGPWSALEECLLAELTSIRLDRPLPAFTYLSLDDDPGDGDFTKGTIVGTMGGYVEFDPSTAAETGTKVTLDVGLKSDPTRLDYAMQAHAMVDMTWRRLRAFPVQAGNYYRMRARERFKTLVLEERILVPDANGLLTVRKLGADRVVRRTELEPYTPKLPEVHIGGENAQSGLLAVSLLAKPNQFAMLTIGSIEGRLTTPFGDWRILDPIFVWGGVTPASGAIEALFPLPPIRLTGVKLLGQGMVGVKLTDLAQLTMR